MWTARELREMYLIQRDIEYRCPICFKVIEFDDEEDEYYTSYNSEIYHDDCIDKLMNECGADYIRECELKEFIQWYYDLTFNDDFYDDDWKDNKSLEDKENVMQFINDDDDWSFLRWANEQKKF